MTRPDIDILTFATKGAGSNEERRILSLLEGLHPHAFEFRSEMKLKSFIQLIRCIRSTRPALVVMEGTGIAGGLALLMSRWLAGSRYVVSSGDAVGPWICMHRPLLGPAFAVYERLLCRFAEGFIGWTPYLAGRALTFGTSRAMTAAGWGDFEFDAATFRKNRDVIRERLGIPRDGITFGIVGSLVWTRQRAYCYGLELIKAILRVQRSDVNVLVVGGGSGLERLQRAAGNALGKRVFITGQIASKEVPKYLAAMDVGSLPQSVDGVGSFRYTTKISEYVTARLPMITGQVPMAYDLDDGWLWRLPGNAPWSPEYIEALTQLMSCVTPDEVTAKRAKLPTRLPEFDRYRQVERVTAFISDILDAMHSATRDCVGN